MTDPTLSYLAVFLGVFGSAAFVFTDCCYCPLTVQLREHSYDPVYLLRLYRSAALCLCLLSEESIALRDHTYVKQRDTRFSLVSFGFSEYEAECSPSHLQLNSKCPPNFTDMLDDFELQQLEALREQKQNYGGVSASPVPTVCFRLLYFSSANLLQAAELLLSKII